MDLPGKGKEIEMVPRRAPIPFIELLALCQPVVLLWYHPSVIV